MFLIWFSCFFSDKASDPAFGSDGFDYVAGFQAWLTRPLGGEKSLENAKALARQAGTVMAYLGGGPPALLNGAGVASLLEDCTLQMRRTKTASTVKSYLLSASQFLSYLRINGYSRVPGQRIEAVKEVLSNLCKSLHPHIVARRHEKSDLDEGLQILYLELCSELCACRFPLYSPCM